VPGRTSQDPSDTAINGALAATFDNYLAQTLHYTSNRLYKQSSGEVFKKWDWKYRSPINAMGAGVGYTASPNVAPALARAMNNDPGMLVMFNNGYYDMATPFYATDYTVSHMAIPPDQRSRVHFYYYPVGHMLYVNLKAMPALQKNIDTFISMATTK